jgi:uncharacterized protein YjbJ (UPF0337 family)
MTKSDHAGQARKSLIDSVKGKVKEVAGAVMGNDSLTAEGQLEQTQAMERSKASAAAAEAEVEAAQAETFVNDAKTEGVKGRFAAAQKASATEQTVRDEQAAQKSAAEVAGAQDAARAQQQVERAAQGEVIRAKADERAQFESAAKGYVSAVDDHRKSVEEAELTEAQADRLRRRADEATDRHDLS